MQSADYIQKLISQGEGQTKDFGHKSQSRNPLIVSLFMRMNGVEKVGFTQAGHWEIIDKNKE